MKRKPMVVDLSALGIDDDAVINVTEEEVEATVNYTPPSAITLSVRDCRCTSCGGVFREQVGTFVEYRLPGNTLRLERLKPGQLAGLSYLPRRVDYAPEGAVETCSDCWLIDWHFEALVRKDREHLNPETLL